MASDLTERKRSQVFGVVALLSLLSVFAVLIGGTSIDTAIHFGLPVMWLTVLFLCLQSSRQVDSAQHPLRQLILVPVSLSLVDAVHARSLVDQPAEQFLVWSLMTVAAVVAIGAGTKLIGPLLDDPAARTSGIVMIGGMCSAIGATFLLSLPLGARDGISADLVAVAAVLGLLAWAVTLAFVRSNPSVRIPNAHLLMHGAASMFLVPNLLGYAASMWAAEDIAVAASGGLVALALRPPTGIHVLDRSAPRRQAPTRVVAVTMTLLVPGAAWLYLAGRDNVWVVVAINALCIALFGRVAFESLQRRDQDRVDRPALEAATTLRLHFQPIIRVTDGEVVGAEALLRTVNESGVAERAPVIIEQLGRLSELDWVTDFVLAETFREGSKLLTAMQDPDAFVSFNLSPDEVSRTDLLDRIQHALIAAGCEATGFAIELTEESTSKTPGDDLAVRLGALQDLGFVIILDDFGVGRANLVSLSDFEFDLVKLDRSFVRAARSPRGDQLLRRTIDLASSTGARIVLEGIEDDDHSDLIRRHRPDFAQGFAYAEPKPMADLLVDLTAWPQGRARSVPGGPPR